MNTRSRIAVLTDTKYRVIEVPRSQESELPNPSDTKYTVIEVLGSQESELPNLFCLLTPGLQDLTPLEMAITSDPG